MTKTYATAADTARTIRTAIKKELGYTSKQVSVRCSNFSMGSSVDVRIKVRGIDVEAVDAIAKRDEKIHRCERTGEILSGGNRYISTSYDWKLLREIAAEFRAEVETAAARALELGTFEPIPGGCIRNEGEGKVTVTYGEKVSRHLWDDDAACDWMAANFVKLESTPATHRVATDDDDETLEDDDFTICYDCGRHVFDCHCEEFETEAEQVATVTESPAAQVDFLGWLGA